MLIGISISIGIGIVAISRIDFRLSVFVPPESD
jgi:hypothetical protein